MQKRTCVPTVGYDLLRGRPAMNQPGKARMNVALAHSNSPIDIVGGKRDREQDSEARVYESWLWQNKPEEAEKRLGYILAQAKLSPRDMWDYAGWLCGHSKDRLWIEVVSYPIHRWRCKWSLRWAFLLRGRWPKLTGLESHEKPAYSPVKELVLAAITLIDPLFIWLGLPLVWLANRQRQ